MLKERTIHYVPAGQGPCIRYGAQAMNVKVGAAESNGALTIIEDVIPPDSGPPLHVHEKEDESYYVLEGEFEFVCGQSRVNGGTGTFVFAPRGLPIALKTSVPRRDDCSFRSRPAASKRFSAKWVRTRSSIRRS